MCCNDVRPEPVPADPSVIGALDHLKATYERIHTDAMRNTPSGHWINEAFVVRLWTVLEAHNVVAGAAKQIDKSLAGGQQVYACSQLRNKIAHTTADVDSAGSRAVDRKLRKAFKLGDEKSILQGKYILSKDKVLRPMWQACRDYSEAVLGREASLMGSEAGKAES